MKRHAMVILLVCIIIFFYFIRKNYFQEGFLTYGGAFTATGSAIATAGTACSNICYNGKDGNFYIAVNSPGKIVKMTPTGGLTDIITTTSTITGTTNKLTSGDTSGPWGICADYDGHIYFTNQAKNQIYKLRYGNTTAELFADAPSGSSRPMGMACEGYYPMAIYADGTSVIVKYTVNGPNRPIISNTNATGQSMGVGTDDGSAVWWATTGGNLYKDGNLFASNFGSFVLGMIFDSAGNIFSIPSSGGVWYYDITKKTNTKIYTTPSKGQGICWGPNKTEFYVSCINGEVHKITLKCSSGTYSASGAPPCTPCPTTNISSCPQSGNPTCATGFQLNTGTGTTCDPIPCAPNTFSDSGSGTCTPCPANGTCPGGTTAGIVCNTNFTKTGTGASTTCQPTPCTANTNYSTTGKMPCEPCPTNFATCPITGPPTCTANFNYNPTTKVCDPKPCATGTTYSTTGNMPCLTCPANATCPTTTGFTCSSGYVLDTTTNSCLTAGVACPIGSYSASGLSPPGTTTCPTLCPTGFTTSATGSKLATDCKRSVTAQDFLTWLNTNNYNITAPMTTLPTNAKYYGLTLTDFSILPGANLPTLASGATYSGTLTEVETYLKPSIVAAATLNYANKSSTNSRKLYFLTNSQGYAVNASGATLNFPTRSMPYTKGTDANRINNIIDCTSMTDPTSCTYRWAGVNGPSTANPCPPLNSWFDFDQSACIDGLGKPTTTKVQCSDSSVYKLDVNSCVPVRKAVKAQPPNTTGTLGPGDYKNCKTIDQGDCQPQYTLGTSITSTNPCSGYKPTYDFVSHTCKGGECCGMTTDQAVANAKCSKYVTTATTLIASKCSGANASNPCCKPANASKPQCAPFYTKSYTFNDKYTEDCGAPAASASASGFQDYKQQFNLTMPPRIKLF